MGTLIGLSIVIFVIGNIILTLAMLNDGDCRRYFSRMVKNIKAEGASLLDIIKVVWCWPTIALVLLYVSIDNGTFMTQPIVAKVTGFFTKKRVVSKP